MIQVVLVILGVLFLIVSVAFGYALVRLLGFAESREEEFFAALALGLPLTAVIAFVLFVFIAGWAPLAALAVEGACAAWLLLAKKSEIGGRKKLGASPGFWPRFLPFVFVLLLFFANGAMHFDADGNLRVTSDFYADAYYHVSLTQYFAHSDARPLQDPQYAGAPVGYPFLTDFYSAMLQRLGFDFVAAFVFPAFVMICVFYAVFYFFVLRLSRSRNAAFFALALLFFSAGFAYFAMFEDASRSGFEQWIQHPPNDYAALEENGKLGNVVQFTKAYLLAQRSSDFGYPVALVVFVLLFEAVRKEKGGEKEKKEKGGGEKTKRKFLFAAGILTGLTPLMRETAFFACLAVAGALALLFIDLKHLREWFFDWTAFFAPALIIAAPQLPLLAVGGSNANYVSVALGWKAHSANPFKIAWFWFRALGLPLAFAVAGFALARRDVKKYYLAFVPLFITANVLSFTPDPLNNMKIINFWEIPTFALAGITLGILTQKASEATQVSKRVALAAVAAFLLFAAIVPGVFSFWRYHDEQLTFYSAGDYAFAQWANAALPQDAVIVSYDGPHALDLVGRARVIGFPGINWVRGRNEWYDRLTAMKDFYSGGNACEIALKYGATHAVVTGNERSIKEFDESTLESNPALNKIYDEDIDGRNYAVYEINC